MKIKEETKQEISRIINKLRRKKMPQTFDVTYTAKTGEEKHIFVKAENEAEALQHAKYQCYTGEKFRNPIITNEIYSTPRQNGFQGSERGNK